VVRSRLRRRPHGLDEETPSAQQRRARAQSSWEEIMERFSRHPKVRHVLARAPLAIAFVTVLALAALAAAAIAATNGTRGVAA
jgi:hypothetical protein